MGEIEVEETKTYNHDTYSLFYSKIRNKNPFLKKGD